MVPARSLLTISDAVYSHHSLVELVPEYSQDLFLYVLLISANQLLLIALHFFAQFA